MTDAVHPNADVHKSAVLGENVCIEAGAVVEADCVIGSNSRIGRHSVIWQGTVLGENNRIFPFCSLGGEPQDKKYAGEAAPLIVGDNNTIREYCFINKGTAASGETRIGNDNWIMAYVHVAHDCVIGSGTTIANMAQFAGHVIVGDGAVIGGGALFHQFRRVGTGAIIGGGEALRHDVPPYALVARGSVSVNSEGLRRCGGGSEMIDAMRGAYRTLYRQGLALPAAVEAIAAMPGAGEAPLAELIEFLRLSDLQLLRPHTAARGD